jgi:hypothetical protein
MEAYWVWHLACVGSYIRAAIDFRIEYHKAYIKSRISFQRCISVLSSISDPSRSIKVCSVCTTARNLGFSNVQCSHELLQPLHLEFLVPSSPRSSNILQNSIFAPISPIPQVTDSSPQPSPVPPSPRYHEHLPFPPSCLAP